MQTTVYGNAAIGNTEALVIAESHIYSGRIYLSIGGTTVDKAHLHADPAALMDALLETGRIDTKKLLRKLLSIPNGDNITEVSALAQWAETKTKVTTDYMENYVEL